MGYLEVSPLAITIFEVQYGMFYLKKELVRPQQNFHSQSDDITQVPFHVFAYENMTEMIWDSANSNVTIVYRWPKNSEVTSSSHSLQMLTHSSSDAPQKDGCESSG